MCFGKSVLVMWGMKLCGGEVRGDTGLSGDPLLLGSREETTKASISGGYWE